MKCQPWTYKIFINTIVINDVVLLVANLISL